MTRLVILSLFLLSACGSDGGTGPDAQPRLVIRSASHNGGIVTLNLENTGGPGTFRIDFWALPNTPNGSYRSLGSSEPIDVEAGYRETTVWELDDYVARVVVYSRARSSAVYREDARREFPFP